MATNNNTNISRQAPFLERHVGQLLNSVGGYTDDAGNWVPGLVDQPYEQYSGPRVAGFSGDQLNAFNLARSGVGAYSPYLTGATNAATNAMSDWNNMAGQSAYWTGQGMQATNVNPYLLAGSQQINNTLANYQNNIGQAQDYTTASTGGTDISRYMNPALEAAQGSVNAYMATMPEATAMNRAATGQSDIRSDLNQARGAGSYMSASAGLGSINPYQNQYRQSVMQDNLREMNRQHEIDQDRLDADAAKAGAFGGSRHGLVEAEALRNYQQNRSDMINQMNMEGFQNAQQMREAHRNRQFQAGQGLGGLYQGVGQLNLQGQEARYGRLGDAASRLTQMGQGASNAYQGGASAYGQLGNLALNQQESGYGRMANAGQALGSMAGQGGTFGLNAATGIQGLGQMSADAQNQTYNRYMGGAQNLANLGQAGANLGLDQSRILSGLGGLQQQYNQNDVTLLSQIGAMGQGQRQAQLDTAYNQWLEGQMQPYQRLGYYSDIIHGVPTSQSTITSTSTPQRSMLAQGLGALGQFASTGQQFGWWGNQNQGQK